MRNSLFLVGLDVVYALSASLLSHSLSANPEYQLGSVIIALNGELIYIAIPKNSTDSLFHQGPQEPTIGKIKVFQKLFLSPGFLSFAGVLIVAALVIVFYFAPRSVLFLFPSTSV